MTDEEIRVAALDAAMEYYSCCTPDDGLQVPRTQIVETARRFEEYFREGT